MAWRRVACLALSIAGVGWTAPRAALAADLSGNNVQTAADLFDLCADRRDAAQVACRFYIHGALQASQMMHAADQGGRFTPLFCPPETLSTDELVTSLQVQVAAHPERRTFPAATVIIGGAIETYPCAKSKAPAAAAPHRRQRKAHRRS